MGRIGAEDWDTKQSPPCGCLRGLRSERQWGGGDAGAGRGGGTDSKVTEAKEKFKRKPIAQDTEMFV